VSRVRDRPDIWRCPPAPTPCRVGSERSPRRRSQRLGSWAGTTSPPATARSRWARKADGSSSWCRTGGRRRGPAGSGTTPAWRTSAATGLRRTLGPPARPLRRPGRWPTAGIGRPTFGTPWSDPCGVVRMSCTNCTRWWPQGRSSSRAVRRTRPSGGALNHAVAVNTLLGYENRVAMTNRPGYNSTVGSNEQVYRFLGHVLKLGKWTGGR
jgi:hypothetical protein